jgi:hemerythrin-like domain-containing protein
MLMIEHRLIERIIELVGNQLKNIETTGEVDTQFIDVIVDFIRVYADRTHHGKEEDILFKKLAGKNMSDQDEKMMAELLDEHRTSRRITRNLEAANAQYREEDQAAVDVLKENLATLAELYPRHIAKEDKVFFPAARKYFTEEEDRLLLEEFQEFDRQMIHEKYRAVVEKLEN